MSNYSMLSTIQELKAKQTRYAEINKKANQLYKDKDYRIFTKGELFEIASLSTTAGMEAGRTIREYIKDWEVEVEQCKTIVGMNRGLEGEESEV